MENSEGLGERKKRESRERIIAAAAALFIERGARAVSLDEVAEAAQVARRTLFNYFPSKEELLHATAAPMLEEAVELCDAILGRERAGREALGLDEVIELCLGLWRSWGRRLSLLYSMDLGESERLAKLHERYVARFRQLVSAALASDAGARPSSRAAGRIVYRCFVPLLLALDDGATAPAELERRFAAGMRGLIKGAVS